MINNSKKTWNQCPSVIARIDRHLEKLPEARAILDQIESSTSRSDIIQLRRRVILILKGKQPDVVEMLNELNDIIDAKAKQKLDE